MPEECDGPEVEPDFVFDLFDGAGEGNFYGTIVLPEEAEAGSQVQFLFDVNLGGFFGASAIQLLHDRPETCSQCQAGTERGKERRVADPLGDVRNLDLAGA